MKIVSYVSLVIDKWNGTLPQFTGSNAVPFINVNKSKE